MEVQFKDYLNTQKTLNELKKQVNVLKKKCKDMESNIQEYMMNNELDSIVIDGCQIVLYKRKITDMFNKQHLVDKLTSELQVTEDKAEHVVDNLFKNKPFKEENRIKMVEKKSRN